MSAVTNDKVCGFDYEVLEKLISKTLRKYSEAVKNVNDVNLSYEDLVQDAWLRIFECNPNSTGHAAIIVRNWIIDKIRAAHRRTGRINDAYNPLDTASNVSDSDEADETVAHPKYGRDYGEELDLFERLALIKNPKERRFAVAKGYLCGGLIELEPEFMAMVNELEPWQMEIFVSSNKDTDDMIYKVFCGIKSGVNAGSSRVIRGGLKAALLGAEA